MLFWLILHYTSTKGREDIDQIGVMQMAKALLHVL